MTARKRTKLRLAEQKSSGSAVPARQPDRMLPFKQELRVWSEQTGTDAVAAFETLVSANCPEEGLMYTVVALRCAWECEAQIHSDVRRMNSRRLRSLVEKTRTVAREWEQEFCSQFGKAVLEQAARVDVFSKKVDYLNLPKMLFSLASETEAIHQGSTRRARPLYNDNLAALMEYVKLKTGQYHDSQVSVLVWFATGSERDANTLGVWRNEHPRPLEHAARHLSRPSSP